MGLDSYLLRTEVIMLGSRPAPPEIRGGEEQRKAERRGTLLFSFMPDLVIYIGIYRILANRIGLDYLQEYSALTEFVVFV